MDTELQNLLIWIIVILVIAYGKPYVNKYRFKRWLNKGKNKDYLKTILDAKEESFENRDLGWRYNLMKMYPPNGEEE